MPAPFNEHENEPGRPGRNISDAQSLSPESFLAALTPKILEYVSEDRVESKPTVKFAGPTEISSAFQDIGCSLPVGTEPVDAAHILAACDRIMEYSVRTSSPLFNNQLYGASDPVGIAGDWMAAALNPSAYTYEVAPVFSLMETELIAKIGSVLGGDFAKREKVDGLFVPGGSISNLYALQVARFRACPQIKAEGNAAAVGLVAFVSEEAHYSYQKACSLMGLGSNNCVKVPTDKMTGAMCPVALKRMMKEAMDAGKRPFFVGCTAGTTVLGAFDPFVDIKEVVDEFNLGVGADSYNEEEGHPGVWMHVDGAWGGASIFSQRQRATFMLGAEQADSFCTNPHKLLGAPQQCCCFMTRHPNLIMDANSASAAYLFQPDKENGELDYGDKTIQCGRKVDTLKLWLMWKYMGDKGIEKRVDGLCDLAHYMSARIGDTRDEQGRRVFVQVAPTSFTNVVFYSIPPSLRVAPVAGETDAELLARLDLDKLADVAPAVKSQMQHQGQALITYQPVKTFPNCWRMVFAGAKEDTMSTTTVDDILLSLRVAAEDIFR